MQSTIGTTLAYRGLQLVLTVQEDDGVPVEVTLHHEQNGLAGMAAPPQCDRAAVARFAAAALRQVADTLDATAGGWPLPAVPVSADPSPSPLS
jgi:hypothetical protein